MTCETGQLMAYRDGALPPEEQANLESHLAECAVCQRELASLRQRAEVVGGRFRSLDPQPPEMPDPGRALARFRETLGQGPSPSPWNTFKGRFEMVKQTMQRDRWRPATIAVTALILVAILFSFAPIREAAADFLGVFRVRKFAVIPVDPAQLERLEDVASLMEATFGQPTMLREPGAPQAVADAQEASALAGFSVRVPTALPEGAYLREFTVATGPAMRLEVARDTAQALLEMADLQGVRLPPGDTMVVEADVPALVFQEYRLGTGRFSIDQLPSPTATLPTGLDPAMLGEVLLQLLGMPVEDAHRVAQTIDWTSTLVVPLPTDVARFREVGVDGVTGLWLEEQSDRYPPSVTILWQRDGVIYMVNGGNLQPSLLLQIADSLQ